MNSYGENFTGMEIGMTFNLFLSKVFGWMFAALLVSFGTAYAVSMSPAALSLIMGNRAGMFVLVAVELGLVFYLSGRILRMTKGQAVTLFMLYAVVNGLTLSYIFLVYRMGTISVAFVVTALMFGAMALRGRYTTRDLTGIGNYLFMGLIGIIVANVINMFVKSANLGMGITLLTIAIFLGLTARDMQQMKRMYQQAAGNDAMLDNLAVAGALTIYLDFVNLFLNILRVLGRRD